MVGTVSLFGQVDAILLPLPIYPKTPTKSVQGEPCSWWTPRVIFTAQSRKVQINTQELQCFSNPYSFPLSLFELYPILLHILQSRFSQLRGDFPEQELPNQDGVSVMMTNIWESTKGRGCQILPLVICRRLGLLPTITQSFLWVVKVTADIQTGPCPPLPQRYPKHSTLLSD